MGRGRIEITRIEDNTSRQQVTFCICAATGSSRRRMMSSALSSATPWWRSSSSSPALGACTNEYANSRRNSPGVNVQYHVELMQQVTFCMRRNGLLKKAYDELCAVVCYAVVALIVVFSSCGRLYERVRQQQVRPPFLHAYYW
ncbi:unnamed protein product [Miscanthus lutarioriparius]|uniref:MADS-box domain-containing protein n=1 Tax=Miscanthus lutarioriparius TaxID=422564 RepID=A0A811RDM6_9POAL|nr:unnamed protein product [Miscanthus lutarioriparius]